MYSYLNGAMLAGACQRHYLAAKWLLAAKKFEENDFGYYRSSFQSILQRILESGRHRLYHHLARRLGLTSKPIEYSDFKCIVTGIPRCGTTSVADICIQQLQLQGGLVDEALNTTNFPREELWSIFLASFSYIQSLRGIPDGHRLNLIDKSTCFSLSKDLMSDVKSKFSGASVIVCQRDGFERAVSAYNRCANHLKLDFVTAAMKEICIIKRIGGVSEIFSSLVAFQDFCKEMSSVGLDYPIVYPTIVMENYEYYMDDLGTDWLTFINIDTKEIHGKSSPVTLQQLSKLNISKQKEIQHYDVIRNIFQKLLNALLVHDKMLPTKSSRKDATEIREAYATSEDNNDKNKLENPAATNCVTVETTTQSFPQFLDGDTIQFIGITTIMPR